MSYSQAGSLFELKLIDSIGFETDNNIIELNLDKWNTMGLDSIELFNPEFKYSMINLFHHENYDCVTVLRIYSEENFHWTCILNKDEKLIDWITTAYDNSEGFLTIKSSLENDKLLVTEWNLYSNTKEHIKSYLITQNGFIVN